MARDTTALEVEKDGRTQGDKRNHWEIDSMSLLMPKEGTLERVFLEALMNSEDGVTFLDLVGTGITEENIEQIAENLRTGMFIAENDNELSLDA